MIKKLLNIISQNKMKIFEVIAIILIICFAVGVSPRMLQNDTFYTVSVGKLIMENGIDMQDHFSWHENLPYTYPHWLYDVGMYLIYNFGGWQRNICIYLCVCGNFRDLYI